jgi:hypothetical protein
MFLSQVSIFPVIDSHQEGGTDEDGGISADENADKKN